MSYLVDTYVRWPSYGHLLPCLLMFTIFSLLSSLSIATAVSLFNLVYFHNFYKSRSNNLATVLVAKQ